jgi:uncharacterized membrane protein YbhN (UPF0104 family)
MLAIVGPPILPPVFTRIVYRLSLPFRDKLDLSLPTPDWIALLEGIAITAAGWMVLGASLWAVLHSLEPAAFPFAWEEWCRYSAYLAIAYVAGFVIVLVPSGLGVREYFLKLFLAQQLIAHNGFSEAEASAHAVVSVLLLRLVWTGAEVCIVAVLYWLPGPKVTSAIHDTSIEQPV